MEQPPPYKDASRTSSQSPGAAAMPGTPMQAAYVTKPGYPTTSTLTPTTSTTHTIVHQPPPPPVVVTSRGLFGEVPVNMTCPTCKLQIVTATEHAPGTLAWLACFGLAAVGCSLGCCFIPFCIDDMKDVTHTCPNCQTVLGIHHRM